MIENDVIDLLKRIISIPSYSKEEKYVADLLEEEWKKYGYIPQRKGNNVWVKSNHFDPKKPTILLDAHIDTVRPNADWSINPFDPIVKDGKLFGLGSNDTGGSIAAMFAAFIALTSKPQNYNLIYLSSAEEENTGEGGIQCMTGELGDIDLALIGEPTGMQAAIAEKGLMVIDATAGGESGHAARNEGINAIYEALADIEWLRNHQFAKESALLGKVKMTVTGIQAGTQHNVIPSACSFMIDIRTNEYYSNKEILEMIRKEVKSELSARSFSLNSSRISEEHPIVKRCEELGLKKYGSPTTSNQAVIPYVSLKIGPGNSARSHSANEYIFLEEIKQGVEIFIRLLDNFSF